jgi:hypothetical protein
MDISPTSQTAVTTSFRLRAWMLVSALALVHALALVVMQGGPLALVTLGTRFSDGDPAASTGSEGYDGQFVYYIARDPSDAARFLDVPAYRFQRILLPALARVLSLGQESLIVWALLAVNLVSLAAGTALMERLLEQYGVSHWYALAYGLTAGTFGAVRLSLPEPLAYALALGGIALALRERPTLSAACFALAALAKETTLVLAAGYGLYLLYQRRWRDAAVFAMITLVPFAAWQAVLYQSLGAVGVGSGGALATSFELVPFMGVLRILTEGNLTVFAVLGVILLPFVLVPTVWGLAQVWRDARRHDGHLTTFLLGATAFVMPFVPFSTYREPLGILRFIVGLQIAVLLYAAHKRNRRALLNSTIWVLTTLFVVIAFRPG